MVYAHQRSIIHRNLEPENVVVTHGDVVKVRDMAELGMARLVRGAAVPMPTATARADLYASPEQRQGRTVGPLTDVYSLGALMYHMVNGHPPFDDTIYSAELPFRPDVPIEWQSMIARAMARNERYRIGSAVQLGRAIAALPAPGAPPARFEEAAAERCARCGREGRGNFCSSCGAPLGTGR
jgi:serine/threonine protein kinase